MKPVRITVHTTRRALPILARRCRCGRDFVPQAGEAACRDCANGIAPWADGATETGGERS